MATTPETRVPTFGFLQIVAPLLAPKTITGAYTLDTSPPTVPGGVALFDCVILCNFSAAHAVTLPATHLAGRLFIVTDVAGNAATDHITITPQSGDINGSSTYAISDNQGSVVILDDGTNYWVIAGYDGTPI
jgi:hypothetical protein